MAKLGVTSDLEKDATISYGATNVLQAKTLKIGESCVVRLLGGPIVRQEVWLPVLRDDRDTGQKKQSWFVAKVSEDNAVFSQLAQADKEFQLKYFLPKGTDPSKVSSQFDSSRYWMYWCIPKKWPNVELDPAQPSVYRLDVCWTIFNKLKEIQNRIDEQSGNLFNGPLWAYDVQIVAKAKGTPRPGQKPNRDYDVQLADISPVFKKMPVSYKEMPEDFDPLQEDAQGNRLFFTDVEWKAAEGFEIDYDSERKPHGLEFIKAELLKAPINLDAMKDGRPMFPYGEHLFKYIKSRLALPASFSGDTKQLSEPEKPAESTEKPVGSGTAEQEQKETPEPRVSTSNANLGW